MTARLTSDEKFIVLEQMTQIERRQIEMSFTKKVNNWWIIKNKAPYANVEESFMSNGCIIPRGLYLELVNVCKEYGYSLEFIDGFDCKIRNCSISFNGFKEYADNLFAKNEKKPKDYQIQAAYSILSYRNCCVEISTSGGKTLVSYLLFRYMKDMLHLRKILFVTPNTNLTSQSAEKFIEYDGGNGVPTDWTYSEIHAKAKKKKTYDDNIIFGNYQSLCKKGIEFFKDIDCILIDEVQHATATSIKGIIKKCYNAGYKVGMTGTFPKDGTYDSFIEQAYIGPIVFRLSSYDLINKEQFATPINVVGIAMDYLSDDRKKALYDARCTKDKEDITAGGKLLNLEKDIARKSRARFNYVTGMIAKTTKNSLVIFSDIQNEYGRRIYEWLRENTDKTVFYVDGGVDSSTRDYAKNRMEDDADGNTVIVASVGTFSEGIDVSNIYNIFLAESTKSEVQISQLIGRGMRRSAGKDKVIFIDFGDDMRAGTGYQKDNYLYRHFKEREKIYRQRGFPYQTFTVKLAPDGPTNSLI